MTHHSSSSVASSRMSSRNGSERRSCQPAHAGGDSEQKQQQEEEKKPASISKEKKLVDAENEGECMFATAVADMTNFDNCDVTTPEIENDVCCRIDDYDKGDDDVSLVTDNGGYDGSTASGDCAFSIQSGAVHWDDAQQSDDDDKDGEGARRPSSPFVLLGHVEQGGGLVEERVVEVAIANLEAELERIKNRIAALRAEERQRRQGLLAASLTRRQTKTAAVPGAASVGSTRRLGGTVETAGTATEVHPWRQQQCTRAALVAPPTAPTAPPEEIMESDNPDGDGGHQTPQIFPGSDETLVDVEGSGAVEDDGDSHENNGIPVLPPSHLQEWLFTLREGSDGLEQESYPVDSNGGSREKIGATVDGGFPSAESSSAAGFGDASSHLAADLMGRYLCLLEMGGMETFEFVFDEDDATKRQRFHNAEYELMLAQQRVIAKMEALRCNRLTTGTHLWQSNESASRCPHCNRAFTITVRKHHCRRCGVLLCNDCCSHVGRDMYAPRKESQRNGIDDNNHEGTRKSSSQVDGSTFSFTDAASVPGSTAPPLRGDEWMFDTCDLTDGVTETREESDSMASAQQRRTGGSAIKWACRRSGLKVRTAPWCRICSRCYLMCLRARTEGRHSSVLDDGRRCFYVLTDDELSFTNYNTTWETRCAQLDVLKHFIMERAADAAHGQLRRVTSLFVAWVRGLGRRAIERGSGDAADSC
ncbi:putative zinc finger protein [Trypanosoma grayi]|uniref:putative zinc finger protein n=1 Tax=Trypanosoma grayi TaxID=71804 RepID=UPI0004F48831|nr:putative zinc finger protein [Trypanosoma grayi]KEG06872.1 putative zinc finger protein [Trypanosoma grayi]